MKNAAALIVIIIICITLSSCVTHRISEETDAPKREPVEETIYKYYINYKDIEFVSDEEKEGWREELIYLFENESTHIGGIIPERSVGVRDRETDYILCRGYSVGLLDVDLDGTPELLSNMGGGSAGNAYYYVYDINTGRKKGSIDGGHEESWCTYFNTATGGYELIGKYQWREGWDERMRFITKAVADDIKDVGISVSEVELFYSHYTLKKVDDDSEYPGVYGERCRDVEFKVNGKTVHIDEYMYEHDAFDETHIRIPNTALQLVSRFDYDSPEQIVDALLSQDQDFISFKK